MGVRGRQDNATVCLRTSYYCIELINFVSDSIYRIPLQAPIFMAREIKARAAALDTVMQEVEIKHPMVRTFRRLIDTLS